LEFLVLTCSWTTDRPPLVEAIAEVEKVLLVINIDNVIAETMKNTVVFGDNIPRIHDLHMGFENATS
jgi:hypothetical protein